MNVLLDACLGRAARDSLLDNGHDVVWAGEWPEDPGDDEILQRAHGEARVLVTLDKDFGTLAVRQGRPHSGIVRLLGFRSSEQGPAILKILEDHAAELRNGALITAQPGRIRVRSSGT